jgi:hypothetical protein
MPPAPARLRYREVYRPPSHHAESALAKQQAKAFLPSVAQRPPFYASLTDVVEHNTMLRDRHADAQCAFFLRVFIERVSFFSDIFFFFRSPPFLFRRYTPRRGAVAPPARAFLFAARA